MAVIKVPTNFNIELEFEVPEFYRRMLALVIDIVIQIFYYRIVFGIINSMERRSNPFDSDQQYNMDAIVMLLLLPPALYHVLMEITMNGQSVGKKIMGLRVVDERGGKASISQFIIRWLLRVSDSWMMILWILLIYIAAFGGNAEMVFIVLAAFAFLITDIVLVVSSKKGQRLGDILAHTIIIRTNTKSDINETVFQEVADSYVPSFPQIMRLSDKDINAIKSILKTARNKGDFTMAANASEKIKSHLGIQTDLSPFDFLEVLLKDYNYLSVK
jgi:uncharacterized RDD family membrane protein YckC